MNDSNYIDIREEWWYEDAIMEMSVDNYNYRFLYGDISILDMGVAGTIYYNKNLYEQYLSANKNGDELYGELNFSADSKAILDINPQIEMPADGNYKGYDKALLFTAKNEAVYAKGIAISTTLKYDIKGNDATGIVYLGAFAKMN